MRLKKQYTFLYMPEDESSSRVLRIPRWVVLCALALTSVFCCLVVVLGLGIRTGAYWRPGGAPLVRDNQALLFTISDLEQRVTELRIEIDGVFAVQNLMASAMDLAPLNREAFAAGIGGRGAGTAGFPAEMSPVMTADLEQMLRQARIQRHGYLAMLDTLDSRSAMRAKIPSIRPTNIGWISSNFGLRTDPFTGEQAFHRGLDFVIPVGTPVHATADGVVRSVQQQRGFGRVVKIDHGNGLTTVYAHLDKALVKKGDTIQRGDVIARSGNTGRSSAPHLHYEVRIGDRPVNPAAYVLGDPILRS